MTTNDFLIVGLGNPGDQYENNRHNIGFRIAERLAEEWREGASRNKWNGLYIPLRVARCKVHLLMPQTYMNRSGDAVCQYLNFYKIPAERLLVIHDDLDMAPCRVKLVRGGGSGGHNGIRSLVERMGREDFYRLKIGIGRPGKDGVHSNFPVEKFVLSALPATDLELLESRQGKILQGIEFLLSDDLQRALGSLNSLK